MDTGFFQNKFSGAMRMKDMALDDYDKYVDHLAAACISQDVAPQDIINKLMCSNDILIFQAIKLRGTLSTSNDASRVGGLLGTEFFQRLQAQDRVGAFLLCFEVGDRVKPL